MARRAITIDELNFELLTAEELTAVIEKATQLRADKLEEAKVALIEETKAKVAALGLDIGGLFGHLVNPPPPKFAQEPAKKTRSRNKAGDSNLPIKYKGPNEGETWTGRGRLPNWLTNYEAEGRKREEFRVAAEAPQVVEEEQQEAA